jgi:hypothetical protein
VLVGSVWARVVVPIGYSREAAARSSPDVLGIQDANTSLLKLDSVRKHMIIVDGSYVGIESGQKYRRFGAEARHGGFIFLSKEDEVGTANVIVAPDLDERDRIVVTQSKFLLVVGFLLQNQDGVIHAKA